MRRFLLTVATAATTLAGAACGDSTGIGGDPSGSYELQTINGQGLPVSLEADSQIEGGVLELDSDGRFIDIIQFRTVGNPLSQQRTFTGTWDRDGSEIELDYDNSTTLLIARRTSSSRLVLEDENGNDWSYRRF
jgi:hypothetical protein